MLAQDPGSARRAVNQYRPTSFDVGRPGSDAGSATQGFLHPSWAGDRFRTGEGRLGKEARWRRSTCSRSACSFRSSCHSRLVPCSSNCA